MLWLVDNAAVYKCIGYRFEPLLAGCLDKCKAHLKEDWYVNMWGSVHWGKIFLILIKIYQSEITKSHMFSISFKLINHKCLMAK